MGGAVDLCALKSDSAGIRPITAQGHQDKARRDDAGAGCTLTPNSAGARYTVQ